MKKLKILCVGKASKPFFRDGCDEYIKRLKAFYDVAVVEIPEQPTVKKECDELLKRMGDRVVLLDIKGEQISSEALATFVKTELEKADELTFVIGGSDGVDERVKAAANKRISFGAVTYPHQLARLLLCEQLYRCATIIKGLPYHK